MSEHDRHENAIEFDFFEHLLRYVSRFLEFLNIRYEGYCSTFSESVFVVGGDFLNMFIVGNAMVIDLL